MTNLAEFYLTDGTTYLNLLSKRNGFAIQNWQPLAPPAKEGGIFQGSPLSDGRRLVMRNLDNTLEALTLAGRGNTADNLILESQRIRRMCEKAVSYWTAEWQQTPVYLIVRGVCETNPRYALLYNYTAPGDGNPFASPFTGPDAAIFTEWELILEHGFWQELPPGQSVAVALAGTGIFNSVTYGQTATTSNQVYIGNKQNKANITHVFYFDSTSGTYSSNLFGTSLPYELLGEPVLVDDILYVGIQTSVTDSGPFASIVWDIGLATGDHTYVAEYWDGAAWTTLLTLLDNTNGFKNTGVNSQHWVQPDDWAAVAVNGITCFYVRFRVTSVGAAANSPTQANRQPYTITWGSVAIDAEQVGGDIPALSIVKIQNQGDVPTGVDRALVGLRSTARGASFSAYINLSDEQNPSGITVTAGTDTAFISDPQTPTGRVARYDPAGGGSDALLPRVTVAIDETLTSDYKGRYRLFLRAIQLGGTAGEMSLRVRASLYSNTTTPYYTSETKYTQLTGEVELFDFGQFVFPPTSQQENTLYSALYFLVDVGSDSTTPKLRCYDLFLLPIDEWAGDYLNPSNDASTVLGNFVENRRLELDPISYPRAQFSAVLKQTSDDFVVSNWQPVTVAPPILQANASQKIWMLVADFSGGTWQSHIENAYSMQVSRQNRYLTMRGAR